jgi:transcriptional regulator with XRE-family HTH domain
VNGAFLRWRRERARLDQRGLARTLGVSGSYLSDVERNRREAPLAMVQAYLRLKKKRARRR